MMKSNSGVLSISFWTVRIGTIVLNEFGEMMKIELKMLGVVIALVSCVLFGQEVRAQAEKEDGYTSLFNGKDLDHWVIPEGDGGHWKVLDGVIDYDSRSEAAGNKNLQTREEFGDFILKIDWRIKETSGLYDVPVVLSDGSYLKDAAGKKITIKTPNADSGIYLRGASKAQLNIWCWPVGSGEVYGVRHKDTTPTEIRAGVTPRINADNPVGEWNRFVIILVKDRVTVYLNDHMVLENAQLPDIPERGPIVLQHHGGPDQNGKLRPASSLVQFRNVWIKSLDP
ncbi:MAG: 3-keto-disaccharide hydrolase [Rubripirellula sp.]